MTKLTLALLATLFVAAAPAHAATFEFYEGNNCTQKKLGSFDTALHNSVGATWSLNLQRFGGIPTPLVPFVFWRAGGWNDEARSVRVTSKWRNRAEHRRARLTVFDNPNGSKSDDYVRVIVDDVRNIPESGICVRSFENNFNSSGVRLERYPQNGIDGKISRIETRCDAACVADKVGPGAAR